jgi:Domain of unknown function (DUF4926)
MQELDHVILTEDIPGHHLCKGDIGILLHHVVNGQDGTIAAYEVEFTSLTGAVIAVLRLASHQIRSPKELEILTVRSLNGDSTTP